YPGPLLQTEQFANNRSRGFPRCRESTERCLTRCSQRARTSLEYGSLVRLRYPHPHARAPASPEDRDTRAKGQIPENPASTKGGTPEQDRARQLPTQQRRPRVAVFSSRRSSCAELKFILET